MKTRILLPALLLLVTSQQVMAWGLTGHRVTGKIAENYLTPEAKAMVQQILPNESLAEASTYADDERSNPAEFWQKTANPFHYVTVPPDTLYGESEIPAEGDAVTALAMFTKTLKKPTSTLEEKQLALRFIIHLIGDLHQPLHAGNGSDRGGNDVKLEFFWNKTNLHSVWDSGMIGRLDLSYTELSEWLIAKISEQDVVAWTTADPLVYIKESTEIRDTIYPEGDQISWQYLYDHRPTVKHRLQQAGVRIAAYLNTLAAK
ncbi:S1/P1 nuclease [Glaciecola sp. 1036]|uniref:S1/P1 nuclease n=1 Tax=Alteromonadaceae TaxID=72275 RepID=UPI003CFF2778